MRRLRHALLVAGFELRQSLRSRKALVLLVLYVAGAAAATAVFVSVLQEVEESLASSLGVAATDRPGAMTEALVTSDAFLDILTGLVGDPDLAAELVRVPPLGLFYGWLALTLVPLLVMLTSADSVASEVGSGSCRFSLTRTDRLAWIVGKLCGQAALLAVGIFAGGVAVHVAGWISMSGFEVGRNAVWIADLGMRAWVYGFAYLGLAVGISQLVRSVNWARGLGLLALVALAVAGWAIRDPLHEVLPVLADSLAVLVPSTHRMDLWQPDFTRRGPAIVVLLSLGVVFVAAGFARFVRRDA